MSRPIREAMCVIGGLLYRFCPRRRGHAHRLPAAPGAMDQTFRTAIEGEKPLRCKERGEKVTDALSYRFCPRCRGHAHRLSAAPGAVDQTVRTAIEGEKPLRCKERGGEGHRWTLVPVLPSMPSLAFSSRVIRATRPGADSAKDRAACTLGSMEPGANWPSASYCRASSGVR